MSDFAEMFGLDSGNELRRSFAFVIGDQLTYDQMQKFNLFVALSRGVPSWILPIPGDFHFYWHVLEAIFIVFWDAGLSFLAEQLKRTGVKREASQGVFEIQHDFFLAVYEGALDALLNRWLHATKFVFSDGADATEGIEAFLKWVEDCSLRDSIFGFWADFVLTYSQLYLDCRYAVRVGDAVTECHVDEQLEIPAQFEDAEVDEDDGLFSEDDDDDGLPSFDLGIL